MYSSTVVTCSAISSLSRGPAAPHRLPLYPRGGPRNARHLADNGQVAFVVDDIASVDPWVGRGFEGRGTAEALTGQTPASPYMSPEVIRIHPRRIISWGMGQDGSESSRRTIA